MKAAYTLYETENTLVLSISNTNNITMKLRHNTRLDGGNVVNYGPTWMLLSVDNKEWDRIWDSDAQGLK